MPQVTDEFVKHAQTLSQAVPTLLAKLEESKGATKEASIVVRTQAECTADTLITHGLLNPSEKSAAVERLSDHGEALRMLNRTAEEVVAPSIGSAEKVASARTSDDNDMRESDHGLLTALGFSV